MGTLVAGRLPGDELAENFAERMPPLEDSQARTEASRCLYCYDAPCMIACPTSIDIPGFINRIATGDTIGSAHKIFEANVLGASCARVCATEELCEQACVLQHDENPIEIGRLQRHATDHLVARGENLPVIVGEATGQHVAIVGGGPAGLAAAVELRTAGHDVTIFERQPQLGGLARYGIIPLREPQHVIDWEVDQVLALGVQARCGVEVGADVHPQELIEAFDAVFVSTGAGRFVADIGLEGTDRGSGAAVDATQAAGYDATEAAGDATEVPGVEGVENASVDATQVPGVEDALVFIERIRTEPPHEVPVGRNVVVVGAGNTAMDACTIAVRLGAESVTCVYRRTAAEMTGYPEEFEHCKRDGVIFHWLTQPRRVVVGADGALEGLECVKVALGEPGSDGRRAPMETDEVVVVPADHVLLATGQKREPALFESFGAEVADARPVVDAQFATSHPGVFAGGDNVLSGKELSVVDAVAQGRDAGREMNKWLATRPPREAARTFPERTRVAMADGA